MLVFSELVGDGRRSKWTGNPWERMTVMFSCWQVACHLPGRLSLMWKDCAVEFASGSTEYRRCCFWEEAPAKSQEGNVRCNNGGKGHVMEDVL